MTPNPAILGKKGRRKPPIWPRPPAGDTPLAPPWLGRHRSPKPPRGSQGDSGATALSPDSAAPGGLGWLWVPRAVPPPWHSPGRGLLPPRPVSAHHSPLGSPFGPPARLPAPRPEPFPGPKCYLSLRAFAISLFSSFFFFLNCSLGFFIILVIFILIICFLTKIRNWGSVLCIQRSPKDDGSATSINFLMDFS